ncbi:GGDEF domain-containing protein [Shewanella surugensis]|uniref:diguanylate cyclase n=1 Tax=Shewanella surugensis TaxID=212020 RepID=A0ABT0L5S2_9GAMM|nr:diguanylate cyclase [Shewanella surugensis]MCL1123026.1 diguanylate cyclase [Shewanella surugensis]
MTNNAKVNDQWHWLVDMVQTIEVGLVVLDKDFNIQLWNGFMENHSGITFDTLHNKNLFEQFDSLPKVWLRQKMESVLLLKNRSFISWEQRPFVFQFKNYRPISCRADFMYQNVTLLPLTSHAGDITHISMIVYDVTDVAMNRQQLKTANDNLERLSQIDDLSQLYNRRHWQICMQKEFDRHHRYGHPTSLVMLDIDYFKNINDNYGHYAGDKVIQTISHTISQSLRGTDFAGRYGGEEFAIVLPETSIKNALFLAERLRQKIAQTTFIFSGSAIQITISIGLCEININSQSSEQWIENADIALYEAKRKGRNCCIQYQRPKAN